jgi:hypothetical protein
VIVTVGSPTVAEPLALTVICVACSGGISQHPVVKTRNDIAAIPAPIAHSNLYPRLLDILLASNKRNTVPYLPEISMRRLPGQNLVPTPQRTDYVSIVKSSSIYEPAVDPDPI